MPPQAPAAQAPTPAAPAGGRPATWEDVLDAEATAAKLPPELVRAVAHTESGLNPSAVSPAGAIGIMQLMPETAKRLGVDPHDPLQNIHGGVMELKRLLDANGGNVETALRLYNASPQAPKSATDPYVTKVLGRLQPTSAAQQTPVVKATVGQKPPQMQSASVKPTVGQSPLTLTGKDLLLAGPSAWKDALGAELLAHKGDLVDPHAIGGGLGAAAMIAAAPETGGLSALALPVLGAASGGAMVEGGEQALGIHTPSVSRVIGEGAEQGAFEVAGQAVPWAAKAVGRRALGFVAKSQGAKATADLLASLPEPAAAGRGAQAVIAGPAQEARDLAGQAVTAAARSGPAVDLRPLKAEAQTIVDRISQTAQAFPRSAVEGEAVGVPPEAAAGFRATFGRSIASVQNDPAYAPLVKGYLAQFARPSTALESAQQEVARDTLKHPAMGVLNRILNADDTVSFEDAHLFKRDLDDALKGKWDQNPGTKKQITSLTQHLRGELRDALSTHAPYNQATSAYQQIVPLYDKEYAAAFRKKALTDPEALVNGIQAKKPTALRMLRDLLVGQSAAGGDAASGQAAWDQVRGAWTRTHLLNRGFDGLDAKLSSLPKEFRDVFFGDAEGQTVQQNLQMIAAASKVAKENLTPEQLGAHAARASLLSLGNVWGALSAMKLALTGPQERDLLEWAAYSTPNTKRLVSLMTGPSPTGLAVSDMLRDAGILKSTAPTVGQSPPTGSHVGQPPPG